MALTIPKIVYPSEPDRPVAPTLSQSVSGALAGRTYYVALTYQSIDGESLAGPESSLAVAANKVLGVASPSDPPAATIATTYNVYVGTTSGVLTKQNTVPIAIGTAWTEPNTGLIAGAAPPATWGTTLSFTYPPRKVPNTTKVAVRHDSVSSAGVRESVCERVDEFLEFDMEWVAKGTEADAWSTFMDSALAGRPFDYYADATSSTHAAYILEDTEFAEAYKSAGQYNFHVKFRKMISGAVTASGPPDALLELAVTAEAPAALAARPHGLGRTPAGFYLNPTSAGFIWFDPTTQCDDTYFYLWASDTGVTAILCYW